MNWSMPWWVKDKSTSVFPRYDGPITTVTNVHESPFVEWCRLGKPSDRIYMYKDYHVRMIYIPVAAYIRIEANYMFGEQAFDGDVFSSHAHIKDIDTDKKLVHLETNEWDSLWMKAMREFFGRSWKNSLKCLEHKDYLGVSYVPYLENIEKNRVLPIGHVIGFIQPSIMKAACKIQAAFRGWSVRMRYRYNPHTSLGKYLVLQQFHELDLK